MTLCEIKEKMGTLQAAIAADAAWIAEKAADPSTPMDEINAKKSHRDELQSRFDMLKSEHDSMEETQRKNLAIKNGSGAGMTEKEVKVKAKADFYRAALTGGDVKKAYEGLGGIPDDTADLGNGSNILPKNVSNELLLSLFRRIPFVTSAM